MQSGNMVKLMKFVYVMTLFLSLFLVAANIDVIYDCDKDSQCVNKVKCKAKLIPVCRNHKCICDPHLGPRTTWSARS
ncbi:unnamed protein product [Trifolium pratense]|uniref:Uncharacterized protein n=1 Tax=Trifolium pratense TaxID=57577 RepID=A0ACB0JVN6_TRIPR|nr:unnamed protein product [Trifolium pratense]